MPDRLPAVLDRARSLGFLGPGDVQGHLDHASAFVEAWDGARAQPPRAVLDLGAGGGVPGLALALAWPACLVVLLDASRRRCVFLREALHELGIEATGAVAHGRAELLARDPALEGAFDLVTARSFAPPGTTAECGVRFLAANGLLVVSEPPDPAAGADRWPSDGLASLGLGAAEPLDAAGCHVVRIPLVSSCPEQYPRRDGVPAKRPLF